MEISVPSSTENAQLELETRRILYLCQSVSNVIKGLAVRVLFPFPPLNTAPHTEVSPVKYSIQTPLALV